MVFALLMILLSTAVWAAPAQSGRPQKLASAGTVPEGLSAPEWSGIRQQYEQQRHGDVTVQEWFVSDRTSRAWITRMGTGFVMVENLFRGHPPGEHPSHRNPFFIRVIRGTPLVPLRTGI